MRFIFIILLATVIPLAFASDDSVNNVTTINDSRAILNDNINSANPIIVPDKASVLQDVDVTPIPQNSGGSSGGGGNSGGGGSGGSGGGGITSSENISNILRYETQDRTLLANQSISFKFNLPVYEILLIGKENEYDVSVRVELLKNTPQKATVKPDGDVIQYFNIITSSKRVKEGVIKFKSNQSATLFKWNGTAWINLIPYSIFEQCQETQVFYYGTDRNKVSCNIVTPFEIVGTKQYYKDNVNNISYNYQIKTDGFSSFAIVSTSLDKPKPVIVSEVTVIPIETPLFPLYPETTPSQKQALGFEGIIALIGLMIIFMVRKR